MTNLDITMIDEITNDLSIMHILYIVNVPEEVFSSKGINFKEFKDKAGNYIAASFIFEDLPITVCRYDYNEENDYMIFASKDSIPELDVFEIVEYFIELLEIYPNGRVEWINESLHDSLKSIMYDEMSDYYEEDIFEELRNHLRTIGLLPLEYN